MSMVDTLDSAELCFCSHFWYNIRSIRVHCYLGIDFALSHQGSSSEYPKFRLQPIRTIKCTLKQTIYLEVKLDQKLSKKLIDFDLNYLLQLFHQPSWKIPQCCKDHAEFRKVKSHTSPSSIFVLTQFPDHGLKYWNKDRTLLPRLIYTKTYSGPS
ncbi:hypothetical protein BpHYR1_038212 [Brachionus plicatilis]|uniref:Uncharacterized protein n=1 Tax=Brachionus plicatilis TaxID=10195 RepID=A0A3M7P8X8_BRAPC|nr:hypothetical protein BpHYR1_038212 [Brachionus plicatilis]